jgi:hypothetical protein
VENPAFREPSGQLDLKITNLLLWEEISELSLVFGFETFP